jgi:hypothetical protein
MNFTCSIRFNSPLYTFGQRLCDQSSRSNVTSVDTRESALWQQKLGQKEWLWFQRLDRFHFFGKPNCLLLNPKIKRFVSKFDTKGESAHGSQAILWWRKSMANLFWSEGRVLLGKNPLNITMNNNSVCMNVVEFKGVANLMSILMWLNSKVQIISWDYWLKSCMTKLKWFWRN